MVCHKRLDDAMQVAPGGATQTIRAVSFAPEKSVSAKSTSACNAVAPGSSALAQEIRAHEEPETPTNPQGKRGVHAVAASAHLDPCGTMCPQRR